MQNSLCVEKKRMPGMYSMLGTFESKHVATDESAVVESLFGISEHQCKKTRTIDEELEELLEDVQKLDLSPIESAAVEEPLVFRANHEKYQATSGKMTTPTKARKEKHFSAATQCQINVTKEEQKAAEETVSFRTNHKRAIFIGPDTPKPAKQKEEKLRVVKQQEGKRASKKLKITACQNLLKDVQKKFKVSLKSLPKLKVVKATDFIRTPKVETLQKAAVLGLVGALGCGLVATSLFAIKNITPNAEAEAIEATSQINVYQMLNDQAKAEAKAQMDAYLEQTKSVIYQDPIKAKQLELEALQVELSLLQLKESDPTLEEKIDYILNEFELTWDQFITIAAVVRQEAGPSYDEGYNVISNIFLRTIDGGYAKYLTPAKCFFAQTTRDGQYVAYGKRHYVKHLSYIEDTDTYLAVIDFFCSADENGQLKPSHDYLYFGAYGTTGREDAVRLSGANEYFNEAWRAKKLSYSIKPLNEYIQEKNQKEYDEKKATLEAAIATLENEIKELTLIAWEENGREVALTRVKNGMSFLK